MRSHNPPQRSDRPRCPAMIKMEFRCETGTISVRRMFLYMVCSCEHRDKRSRKPEGKNSQQSWKGWCWWRLCRGNVLIMPGPCRHNSFISYSSYFYTFCKWKLSNIQLPAVQIQAEGSRVCFEAIKFACSYLRSRAAGGFKAARCLNWILKGNNSAKPLICIVLFG